VLSAYVTIAAAIRAIAVTDDTSNASTTGTMKSMEHKIAALITAKE
jgi:hypothetical protein